MIADSGGEGDGLASFFLLEQHRQQLSRGGRLSGPSRRYEDRCLVAAILSGTAPITGCRGGSEDARSTFEQGLLSAVDFRLTHLDADIDSARRWLRPASAPKS